MSNRDLSSRRQKPRGRHLFPSKSRRYALSGRKRTSNNASDSNPAPNGKVDVLDRPIVSDLLADTDPPREPERATQSGTPGHNGKPPTANGTVNGSSVANGGVEVVGNFGAQLWNPAEVPLPHSRLRPGSSHSLRQIATRRSRSGMWATLAVVLPAAAVTVALLMLMGNADRNHAETRASVLRAAEDATAAVDGSVSILDSLRAESSFTPELVVSISSLGDASRALVESVTDLPSDEPSLVELRMQATGLAGRVSRLGETFGAALSYRGQVEPLLALPRLGEPLNVALLTDNATLLTDWQFQLEQAATTPPSQPRLLKNHEALSAMLPYIAVHRQVYVDAVGNGQPDQATAALSQIGSLLSALRQDFDRAYLEITEIAQAEIRSLSSDLYVLSKGTAST